MSESKIKEEGASFAGAMSAAFASGFTTSILNDFETNYSFFIGSFDIVSALINLVVFSVLFYPFSKFFRWLYSESPNNAKP